MSDPVLPPPAQEGAHPAASRSWWPWKKTAPQEEKTPFTFTDDGCRTEIRLGLLLALAAIFLWLWLGPALSARLYLLSMPLWLCGVPIQAWQARRAQRPGYPLKIGLVLLIGGILIALESFYRESVDGALSIQPMGPLLALPGLWILAWFPWTRMMREEHSHA